MTGRVVAGQLRDVAEIRAAYAALDELPEHVQHYPKLEGLRAGFAWVLGLSDKSPARGVPGRPTGWEDVRYEGQVAEASAGRWASISNSVARRPAPDPPPRLDKDYAKGAAAALKWSAGLIVGANSAPTLRDDEQLRSPAEISAAREAAVQELDDANARHRRSPVDGDARRDRDFMGGAVAAYDWLLGRRTTMPLSEETIEPLPRWVRYEEDVADAAIRRAPKAPKVRQHWAVGVQHALMWARHAADHPPGG